MATRPLKDVVRGKKESSHEKTKRNLQKKKPEWNVFQHDQNEFRLSREELEAKKKLRTSTHRVFVSALNKKWTPPTPEEIA
eukprot:CAMPEP_0118950810 /NCGR_PEP_ID=MMETSP1169-20130426/52056_1 /TAXON_ID=36882 /ORGANISM="Pyramimonas obovata, Strain CCMP722" /LENGTH=80 /DNA_ID=CAMNT_0006897729 /DNA_START=126 /DNA_END=365 /DNA_ORIENTATION=+